MKDTLRRVLVMALCMCMTASTISGSFAHAAVEEKSVQKTVEMMEPAAEEPAVTKVPAQAEEVVAMIAVK